MKTFKSLVLLLAAVMMLVACGAQDPPDNDDPDPTTGTLVVNVTDADGDALTATIEVTDADGNVEDTQTDSSFTWNVDPGTYTVNVSAAGFQSASQSATIAAGATSTLSFQLAAVDIAADEGTLFVSVSDGTGPLEATIVVSDADGDEVDTQTNSSYTWPGVPTGTYSVSVSAAGYFGQTEEVFVPAGGVGSVRFTLTALADELVGNVESVEVLGFFDVDGNEYDKSPEVNLVKDVIHVAAQTEEQVGVQVLVTDAAGNPVANAPVTVSITGEYFYDELAIYSGKPADVNLASGQTFTGLITNAQGHAFFTIEATNDWSTFTWPAKLIVSAVGADEISKRAEFKSWFINMSHLWFGTLDFIRLTDDDPPEPDMDFYSPVRKGHDFGTRINIWETGPQADNTFGIGTWAIDKQPNSTPFRVGDSAERYPGYVRYEIIDVSTDDDGDPLVQFEGWDTTACNYTGKDVEDLSPLVCDNDGSGVTITPVSGVGLEDLPVEATVKATYVLYVSYGGVLYTFELKDYTFTKTWVGGFLGIDKYVDQHVLTWSGATESEPVTLPASEATVLSDYVSTVYISVTNPSQSTLYGITITDAVPAELGVLEDTISDGGTYQAATHTITWENVLGAQELAPGDPPIEVSFKVYARHKPGYCWEGEGDGSFVVPPQRADIVGGNEDDDGVCLNPYNDPYLVVNGEQFNSVSAAAYFTDTLVGDQVVFNYAPTDDEADIWVVRPFFTIEKTRQSSAVMTQNAAADFEIKVGQRDRVSTEVDPFSTEYAFLYELYPWEFGGNLGDGSGHVAPSSQPRENPFARNVQVYDSFEVGLDFTQGVDFDGSLIFPTDTTKVVGQDVTFGEIEDLPRGTFQTATVKLQGVLVSDDNGVSQNNADATIGDQFAWRNCAYLDAPQLNQPFPSPAGGGDSGPIGSVFESTIYSGWAPLTGDLYPLFGDSILWLRLVDVDGFGDPSLDFSQYHQIDEDFNPATPLIATADPAAVADPDEGELALTRVPDHADGSLEDCALVVVIPAVQDPFINVSTNGEALVSDPAAPQNEDVSVGDTFFYRFTVQNTGSTPATGVAMRADVVDAGVEFTGTYSVYRSSDGLTWTPQTLGTTTNVSLAVVFQTLNIPEGGWVRVVLEADADASGQASVDFEVTDYTNRDPAVQTAPIGPVKETTNVKP